MFTVLLSKIVANHPPSGKSFQNVIYLNVMVAPSTLYTYMAIIVLQTYIIFLIYYAQYIQLFLNAIIQYYNIGTIILINDKYCTNRVDDDMRGKCVIADFIILCYFGYCVYSAVGILLLLYYYHDVHCIHNIK